VILPEVGETATSLPLEQLQEQYAGHVVLVRPVGVSIGGQRNPADRYQGLVLGNILRFLPIYRHVLLATVIVNLLALAGPLFVLNVYDGWCEQRL